MKNNSFIIIFFVLVSLFLVNISFFEKGEILLLINNNRTLFFDNYFAFLTIFGDGLIFLPLTLILLFFKYKHSIASVLAFLFHGIPVVIIKNFIASDLVRPKLYFSDPTLLNTLEGISLHGHHSFPSGHTATAFAAFLLIGQLSNKNWIKWVCLSIAISVGISRVYLLQHFTIDVIVGAFLGYLAFYFSYLIFNRKLNKNWMNKKIILPELPKPKVSLNLKYSRRNNKL